MDSPGEEYSERWMVMIFHHQRSRGGTLSKVGSGMHSTGSFQGRDRDALGVVVCKGALNPDER